MDNHGQWNSCTRDHLRDTDNIFYNHDHNGNGLGDDQWQDGDYQYAGATVDIYTGCPMDTNGDGRCDTGGCLRLNSGLSVTSQFLTLYELDWPDSDDLVTTLYVDSQCCRVNMSCTARSCSGPVSSSYYPSVQSTNTAVTAKVRLVVKSAAFVDRNNYCYYQGLYNRAYRCY